MRLYNTLTRSTEELHPLDGKAVKLYTCGLTVYSQPHIGNWIGYIYWDVLVRTLRASGFAVERTQNITDVGHLTSDDDQGEDKMEKGARAESKTAWDVADKYIAVADREATELNLLPSDHLVRATDTIAEQIEFARVLDEKGYLYRIDGDGMYFDTSKLPEYGRLARLDIDGLQAGARVDVEGKRNITDFAVWKFSPANRERDMEWGSPWGTGFPGWHLECSVIARTTLGDQIDIHTGGIDHIPVHHINEIAQTEAVTGKQFSQFWVHNNHLKVDGHKMSKSLGNIYTMQDIQDRGFTMDDFRVFALGKHYRTEGNFTWDNLEAAANRLGNMHATAALVWQTVDHHPGDDVKRHEETATELEYFLRHFLSHLQNDLDTPQALRAIGELFSKVDASLLSRSSRNLFRSALLQIDKVFGLHLSETPDLNPAQQQLLESRDTARAEKNWAESDRLRDELAEQGIGLRDTQYGAIWYRLRNNF